MSNDEDKVTVTDSVYLVIENDSSIMWNHHLALGRDAIKTAPECEPVQQGIWTVEQAKVFLLADAIKDFYEDLIDDVQPKWIMSPVKSLSLSPVNNFRTNLIQTLTRNAFYEIDFNDLARTILTALKENGEE